MQCPPNVALDGGARIGVGFRVHRSLLHSRRSCNRWRLSLNPSVSLLSRALEAAAFGNGLPYTRSTRARGKETCKHQIVHYKEWQDCLHWMRILAMMCPITNHGMFQSPRVLCLTQKSNPQSFPTPRRFSQYSNVQELHCTLPTPISRPQLVRLGRCKVQ